MSVDSNSHVPDLAALTALVNKSLESISAASRTLDVLQGNIDIVDSNIRAENASFAEVKQNHDKQILALHSKRSEINSQISKVKSVVRENKEAIKNVQTRIEVANEAARLSALAELQDSEFAALLEKFDHVSRSLAHQIPGAKKLATAKRGILADVPGLGKSYTSMIWADLVGAKKLLLIVPNDVQTTFEKQIARWVGPKSGGENGKKRVNARTPIVLGGKTNKNKINAMFNDILPAMEKFTIIVNYEAFRRNDTFVQNLINLGFDSVIIDESHNLKNSSSATAKKVREIISANNYCEVCSLKEEERISPVLESKSTWARFESHPHEFPAGTTTNDLYGYIQVCKGCDTRRPVGDKADPQRSRHYWNSVKNLLLMTGTPILNKPQDLYSQLNLINPELFHSENGFLRSYCSLDANNRWGWRYGGEERIARDMQDFYVRRTYDDAGIVLPDQDVIVHELTLTEEFYKAQLEAYRDLVEKQIIQLESNLGDKAGMSPMIAITMILRQRQMTVWPAGIQHNDEKNGIFWRCNVEESIKIDKLIRWDEEENDWVGLIPEAKENNRRSVLFSQFKPGFAELQARCEKAGIKAVIFDGDTKPDVAEKVRNNFNKTLIREGSETPEWDIVLANYRKGGVGIDFTDCGIMFILDEEWNPGKRDQAYHRINRIGQDAKTEVHVLRVLKTADVWMSNLIDEKEAAIAGFETATVDLGANLLSAMKSGEIESH